jgi:hypothetical protein
MEKVQNKQVEESTKKNPEMHYLWWHDNRGHKRFSAGRAFYSVDNGDFCVHINLLETSSKNGMRDEYYLKPVLSTNESIYFRLEKVIHKNDRTLRVCVGEGIKNSQTNGDIHIQIEPLTGVNKKLILKLDEKKEQVNE